jgi:hypothetical protein
MDLPEQVSDLVDSLLVPQPYKVREKISSYDISLMYLVRQEDLLP